jgi:hypothetical protein
MPQKLTAWSDTVQEAVQGPSIAPAPADTSSPRATIESFLARTEEVGRRYLEYQESPSPATQDALRGLGSLLSRFDTHTAIVE